MNVPAFVVLAIELILALVALILTLTVK